MVAGRGARGGGEGTPLARSLACLLARRPTRPAHTPSFPSSGLGRWRAQSVLLFLKALFLFLYIAGNGTQGLRHNASEMFTKELLSPAALSLQSGGREQAVWRQPLPVALGPPLLGRCAHTSHGCLLCFLRTCPSAQWCLGAGLAAQVPAVTLCEPSVSKWHSAAQ